MIIGFLNGNFVERVWKIELEFRREVMIRDKDLRVIFIKGIVEVLRFY